MLNREEEEEELGHKRLAFGLGFAPSSSPTGVLRSISERFVRVLLVAQWYSSYHRLAMCLVWILALPNYVLRRFKLTSIDQALNIDITKPQ